jgi:hypothetical protein
MKLQKILIMMEPEQNIQRNVLKKQIWRNIQQLIVQAYILEHSNVEDWIFHFRSVPCDILKLYPDDDEKKDDDDDDGGGGDDDDDDDDDDDV